MDSPEDIRQMNNEDPWVLRPLDLASCGYLHGGVCSFGCEVEPRCVTEGAPLSTLEQDSCVG